jgi:PAS domain S-box-containing protein
MASGARPSWELDRELQRYRNVCDADSGGSVPSDSISVVPSREELFEFLIDSCTDFAIFTTDANGVVTTWNVGAARLFGYTEDEMVGHNADKIFVEEDRFRRAPEQERAIARKEGRAIDERWHQRKDGSQFWASGLLMPLKHDHRGFVKIARDRTANHIADERLLESERRFRLLATSIPQLVFLTRPDGTRTWPSPQWIKFTGIEYSESLGLGWLDAIHPDDREVTLMRWGEARDKGEYYIEHRVRRYSDGDYLWHQTRAKPLDPDVSSSQDWVGTMTDIDALRGLQGRQEVLTAELQHRTRNLLSVVQAVASQTLRSSESLDIFKTQFSGRLRAISRVQSLLAQERHAVDLHELVTAELAAHAFDPSDKILVEGPNVVLPASVGQAVGLALHELATNAVKYGALAQDEGKLKVMWTLREQQTGQELTLIWQESGIAVQTPKRKGYGRELIENALPYQLDAKTRLQFGKDTVCCEIVVAFSQKFVA